MRNAGLLMFGVAALVGAGAMAFFGGGTPPTTAPGPVPGPTPVPPAAVPMPAPGPAPIPGPVPTPAPSSPPPSPATRLKPLRRPARAQPAPPPPPVRYSHAQLEALLQSVGTKESLLAWLAKFSGELTLARAAVPPGLLAFQQQVERLPAQTDLFALHSQVGRDYRLEAKALLDEAFGKVPADPLVIPDLSRAQWEGELAQVTTREQLIGWLQKLIRIRLSQTETAVSRDAWAVLGEVRALPAGTSLDQLKSRTQRDFRREAGALLNRSYL